MKTSILYHSRFLAFFSRLRTPLLLCVLAALGCSCGSSVKIKVLKPAEINMADMRKISILPFDYTPTGIDSFGDFFVHVLADSIDLQSRENRYLKESAAYATDKVVDTLHHTGYFQIINAGPVQDIKTFSSQKSRAVEIGAKLGVDAILIGKINKGNCKRLSFNKEESHNGKKNQVPWIRQKCDFAISYQVINTTTDTIIARKHYSRHKESEVVEYNKFSLPEPDEIFKSFIDDFLPEIARQLAPYTVLESRKLLKDETENPFLGRAFELIDSEQYEEAQIMFYKQWQNTGNPVAGYNAAILNEALGKMDKAIEIMAQLEQRHQDALYKKEGLRLRTARDEQRTVREEAGIPVQETSR